MQRVSQGRKMQRNATHCNTLQHTATQTRRYDVEVTLHTEMDDKFGPNEYWGTPRWIRALIITEAELGTETETEIDAETETERYTTH